MHFALMICILNFHKRSASASQSKVKLPSSLLVINY